jgi:hypothetical protein
MGKIHSAARLIADQPSPGKIWYNSASTFVRSFDPIAAIPFQMGWVRLDGYERSLFIVISVAGPGSEPAAINRSLLMAAFQLSRTELPVLEFSGIRLLHLNGADSTGGRHHDLTIYRTDDGQFVAAVSYRSPYPSELQDDYVEAADSVEEIDEILSLYDPTERIDSELFEGVEGAHHHPVKQTLMRHYDQQVAEALEILQAMETVES